MLFPSILRRTAAALALSLAASAGVAAAPTGPVTVKPLSPSAKAALSRAVFAKPAIGHFTSRRTIPRLATAFAVTVAPASTQALAPKLNPNVARAASTMKTCEALDPSIPPAIRHIKGKVGSGGYLLIDGECFGTTGVVELVGEFPGGRLPLQNQAWSATSITAAIPSVTGVYDQTVHIRVLRGNIVSNEVAAAFVPEMEERVAPAPMVASSHCDFDVNECKDGSAAHHADTGSFVGTASNGKPSFHSGDDQWTVRAPRGWSVSYVEGTLYAGVATIGDYDSSPGTPTIIGLHWEDNLTSYTTNVLSLLGNGPSNKYFTAAYALSVHVAGPKGTWQ